jgi:CHAT domain-containing protein/Tfp pilus assembly protein PilF
MAYHAPVPMTACFRIFLGLLVWLPCAEASAQQATAEPPPWQRLLNGKDAKRVEELEKQIDELRQAGKYTEAQAAARTIVEIRHRVQGADHWQTRDAERSLAALQEIATLSGGSRKQLMEAARLRANAVKKFQQSQLDEAVAQLRRALDIRQKYLGPRHIETARTLNDLAFLLRASGQYSEAARLHRQANQLFQEFLGKEHPDTAQGYDNLAGSLLFLGRHAEAEVLYRKALAIRQSVLGEAHADTAQSYNNLAAILNAQGLYAEADPFYRRALAVCRKVLGTEHPDTATTANNLAENLYAQGKYAEAEEMLQEVLSARRKILGENHPATATSYNNLGANLAGQHRYAEAEPLYRRALAIRRDVWGAEHPDTALSYNNLARCLSEQRRYAEAEPLLRRGLSIREKMLGEAHPATAESYNNLGGCLEDQERHAEAEVLFRRALAIYRKVLRKDHPDIALACSNLGSNLVAQGKPADSEPLLEEALALRRAALGVDHPDVVISYNNLAASFHAQGRHAEAEDAWTKAVRSFDIARLRSGRTGVDRAAFAARNSPLPALAACMARNGRPAAAWNVLEAGLSRGLLDDLTATHRRKRLDGFNATLDGLHRQITTLLARHEQTETEAVRYKQLVAQRQRANAELDRLAAELGAKEVYDLQRIQAVLPADVALAAWVDSSGSSAAERRYGEHWACVVRRTGAPAWVRLPGSGKRSAWTEEDEDVPSELYLSLARPSNAGRQDWQAIAPQAMGQRLAPLESHLQGIRHLVVLSAWRMAGIPVEVLTDRFTVSYAPSATVFARLQEQHQRATDRRSAQASRALALGDPQFSGPSTAWPQLPGTRIETQAIAQLFADPVVLLGAEASARRLAQLAAKNQLRQFRYFHLATHGAVDNQVALNSALVLAPDQAPGPAQRRSDAAPQSEGRLTAEQILQTWKLDADLVVLSACQSALGKQAGGEGYLGFAQALFLAGARSLVLSLWKVDDTATALLMVRFYQNFLGKRPGLTEPLSKADALREAKHWLRGLTASEVAELSQQLQNRVIGPTRPRPTEDAELIERPYAHPYYWSAFILVGDPS